MNSVVKAEDLSYKECIDKFYALVNQGDFRTIYKDMTTSRFKNSADFSVFQGAMQQMNQNLGTVEKYEESYKYQDNRFQGMSFYRAQYYVLHPKCVSEQRFVVMKESGKLLVDGYAVLSNGKFEIAQGNINFFDKIDKKIAQQNSDTKSVWEDVKQVSAFKDSQNIEAVNDSYRRRYYAAILLAASGNFKGAQISFDELIDYRVNVIEDINKTVLKDALAGKTNKTAAQLYFKAVYVADVDEDAQKSLEFIEQAIKADSNFTVAYIVAAGMNLNHNDEISYQYIEKALALEPQNILARSLLSYYYAQKEDSSGAYKEIMTVIQDLKKFIPLAQFFISQGIEKKYFDNGSVEFKAKFVNGRPEGAYKVFFPTGKIKEEGQYKNGQLQGWGTVYYPKGSIFISFEHDNGQLIELTQYDESGGIVEQFSLGK